MVETLAPALVRVWVESLVHSWDLLKADLKVASLDQKLDNKMARNLVGW